RPLVIAGTPEPGATLDRVKALAARHANVQLFGFLEQSTLNALYAACKVFCLPSHHEGTGLAALEAATYGAAVVITRRGGTRDYFGDLVEYVEPENDRDIRAAVTRAWDRPRSHALRDYVLRSLTWERSATALADAYQRHSR